MDCICAFKQSDPKNDQVREKAEKHGVTDEVVWGLSVQTITNR